MIDEARSVTPLVVHDGLACYATGRGARLAIFEHSGHYPFMEERDLFPQTLAEFLA